MIGELVMEQSQKNEKFSFEHSSVMLSEVVEYLNLDPIGIYVDGTLGLGGHAKEILMKMSAQGRLIGFDRDHQSLDKAKEVLTCFASRCSFVHSDFSHMRSALKDLGIHKVNGILLDLGISSFQLDDPQRGFSIRNDGPLDMRMDQNSQIAAFDLVNSLTEKELSTILKDYGEERFANRIARHIVYSRGQSPIGTTHELSRIVCEALPSGKRREKIHPATRTFQAIRIAVNQELVSIEKVIKDGLELLEPNGRFVVISFHSLEDRIVKHKFKEAAKSAMFRILTKKPVRPSEQEVSDNPRARSARLRVIERIT